MSSKFHYDWYITKLFDNGYITGIPITSVFSQFNEINNEINLRCLESDAEGVTITELGILCWIASNTQPASIFEFGTANGRTTLNLALNTNDVCRIWTLDLPNEQRLDFYEKEMKLISKDNRNIPFKYQIGKCFQEYSIADKITQLFGDSMQLSFNSYYKKMDYIFIDANHDYPHIKSDSENALKMLSNKGTILWHEYPYWPGVWKYLDELSSSGLPLFHIKGTKLVCYSRIIDINNIVYKNL